MFFSMRSSCSFPIKLIILFMKLDLDPLFGSLPPAFEHGFRDACLRVSFSL